MINEWELYLWEKDKPLNKQVVSSFEKRMGITYPEKYLEIMNLHQGKTPNPASILINNNIETAISCLLHFADDDYENVYNVETTTSTMEDNIPYGVIPFADSPGDDYFCFDFRIENIEPKVIFFSHELKGDEAIFPVADSFKEFLDKIYSS
ncbi:MULTISPECIES: SMI1/KNR4 family protein [unclassified Pseudoalteromonas]|uniref:SMI1/KNR4 family protein n=1 Tax=unclassified Pseudoalteromonas TaxID=194690 RepID=UPI0013FD37DC|nr:MULTISPECIES: SMI1/KNR4 family protein [unclassified Pseudoalteromonas]MBG9990682.1 SMI1/KNR4 family protein [Pseudoalteromonas sp. NZS37]